MIHDLLLRWVVTGLFALGALECALPILTGRRPWTVVVSHSLHFLMAVGMAVMAWPWSTQSPSTGPAVFFLLSAGWFTAIGIIVARSPGSRLLYAYHVVMMLATAWMYADMNGPSLSGHLSAQPSASMSGMQVAAMNGSANSAAPPWFSVVNWLGAIIFVIAAAFWTGKYFVARAHAIPRRRSWGDLAQAALAGGMAILFLAALFTI
ncbi:DUF5134 domain-containing protein [Mycobacterium intracellulare]|uniref:DUF5134 domain-containing protein n=1 Tax=Mycobacterium intracellulare subsp. chimaera TaxID=222805 RepID=A0A7U5MJB6_MYCIT|nr:DUF5134 domain-containing protein [Mycobacterium intracellulare]ASL14557.1 putative integral membrane protein [Mycobacterium intracellulare subsp. chimaera]ASQ85802.1 DUF5134 domain-containing protein [Mycobacterium intracellulare subsp. chimaera]MCF1812600.1 DUF5134 domain-containing protein [Mycobacterium intracellulare subsp. intracellulare]MDM3927388.1 DUF5134 domain-containing protein [Mycobacterium intracellulare subsp. chimaera]MDS0333833.1 DUF5134 domain-containing protein [Mycobact